MGRCERMKRKCPFYDSRTMWSGNRMNIFLLLVLVISSRARLCISGRCLVSLLAVLVTWLLMVLCVECSVGGGVYYQNLTLGSPRGLLRKFTENLYNQYLSARRFFLWCLAIFIPLWCGVGDSLGMLEHVIVGVERAMFDKLNLYTLLTVLSWLGFFGRKKNL